MMHNTGHTTIDAAGGILFGGFFFFNGIRLWLQKCEIQNKPLSKIRSAAMGEAALAGEVKAINTLKAPFSGHDCVYFSYKVEAPDKNGWHEVDSGRAQCIFYLDDGTGQMLVNPEGAAFYGPETYQTIVNESDVLVDPGVAIWLRESRMKSLLESIGQGGRRRFTERVIAAGQLIFVEGNIARVQHVVDGKGREENILSRGSSAPFILSSKPGARSFDHTFRSHKSDNERPDPRPDPRPAFRFSIDKKPL